MTILYGILFAIALVMIGVYYFVDRKRDIWLLSLFVSISICNLGYFLMSFADNLEFALFANRIAYFGNVFLPFFMLLIIMNLLRMKYASYLPLILIAVNTVMLFITISGGFLPIYYKEVAFEIIDGIPTLIKEYGPLHVTYKFYLFGYFGAMVAVIICATVKKTAVSNKHAAFIAFLVIGNIIIWLTENIFNTQFEFVSVSYIVTECLILFLYAILQDYGLHDTEMITQLSTIQPKTMPVHESEEEIIRFFSQEQIEAIFNGWNEIEKLSPREAEVLKYILANKKRQIIAQELFVTESTIKKHTASIYRKLEISNRTELFEKCKIVIQ